MVVTPMGKALPEAGPSIWAMVAPGALSVTVGSVHVTTAVGRPASVSTEMSAGRPAMTGSSESVTVTVKLADAALPAVSVAS